MTGRAKNPPGEPVQSGRIMSPERRSAAVAMGLEATPDGIAVPFFNRCLLVTATGCLDPEGERVTETVADILLAFLDGWTSDVPAEADLVTFRDLEGAGPLVGHFTANTNRIVAETFAGRPADLSSACRGLGGMAVGDRLGVNDVAMRFQALPHLPLYLTFNDRDEMLPAGAGLLFERTASRLVGFDGLFAIGTYLAGSLLQLDRLRTGSA